MPGKRLELLQGCPHNDLNVTRIPFRHPGMSGVYGRYYTAGLKRCQDNRDKFGSPNRQIDVEPRANSVSHVRMP